MVGVVVGNGTLHWTRLEQGLRRQHIKSADTELRPLVFSLPNNTSLIHPCDFRGSVCNSSKATTSRAVTNHDPLISIFTSISQELPRSSPLSIRSSHLLRYLIKRSTPSISRRPHARAIHFHHNKTFEVENHHSLVPLVPK